MVVLSHSRLREAPPHPILPRHRLRGPSPLAGNHKLSSSFSMVLGRDQSLDIRLSTILRKLGFNIQASTFSFNGELVGDSSPFSVLPQKKEKSMAKQDGGDDVRIDIDALSAELESLMSGNVSMSPRGCIFRVPNILLRHNPEAYTPNGFSIGPFHYNKPHLKATQKIKLKYLHGLLSRFPETNPQTKLRDLMAAVSEVREEARECYEGSIDMSMKEFVKVLVLDGCFLIELFRKVKYKRLRGKDDPVSGVNYMYSILLHDLILLENQIPWLVLDRLFEMTMTPANMLPLYSLVPSFFDGCLSRGVAIYQKKEEEEPRSPLHILDLLRTLMILSSSIRKEDRGFNCLKEWQQMPSATSLQEAGIKFKKGTSSAILDVKFKDGVLEIPQLLVHDSSETLFRNLICLEQCLHNCEEVITSYAVLLDNLINTSKDVEILCKSEVFDNIMDIENATVFFNRLFNDISMRHFYYLELTKEVNKYSRRHWPRYRTVLVHNYFKQPWSLISVIVAAVLLILTFLQTLFTIIK